MYCRNCGQEINNKAEICVRCGVKPLAEKKFCQECGAETKPNQELCIKCGVRLKTLITDTESAIPNKYDFSKLPQYYQHEFNKISESAESYKGKWNWAAFFFGPIWALTKGAWLSAVICLVLSILTFGIGAIVYSLIFGFRGNYIYYSSHVKNKQLAL